MDSDSARVGDPLEATDIGQPIHNRVAPCVPSSFTCAELQQSSQSKGRGQVLTSRSLVGLGYVCPRTPTSLSAGYRGRQSWFRPLLLQPRVRAMSKMFPRIGFKVQGGIIRAGLCWLRFRLPFQGSSDTADGKSNEICSSRFTVYSAYVFPNNPWNMHLYFQRIHCIPSESSPGDLTTANWA